MRSLLGGFESQAPILLTSQLGLLSLKASPAYVMSRPGVPRRTQDVDILTAWSRVQHPAYRVCGCVYMYVCIPIHVHMYSCPCTYIYIYFFCMYSCIEVTGRIKPTLVLLYLGSQIEIQAMRAPRLEVRKRGLQRIGRFKRQGSMNIILYYIILHYTILYYTIESYHIPCYTYFSSI